MTNIDFVHSKTGSSINYKGKGMGFTFITNNTYQQVINYHKILEGNCKLYASYAVMNIHLILLVKWFFIIQNVHVVIKIRI